MLICARCTCFTFWTLSLEGRCFRLDRDEGRTRSLSSEMELENDILDEAMERPEEDVDSTTT